MGKQADPGMAGSLLYHMAMVSKMESETQVILDELKVKLPNVSAQLGKIYCDFESDATELLKTVTPLPLGLKEIADKPTTGKRRKNQSIHQTERRKQKS